ncbi:MAG: TauD/TfdA family dioxygenase [Betaproteobacteria bacterium]|nr:TauD/TfdA family dioxygenase [Betaproteobacteria bacterium]
MHLNLKPLHPLFAAEATGVDLRTPPTPELSAAIHEAMNRYAVLVLPGQAIDDEEQLRFAASLGKLEPMPAQVELEKQRLKHREMVDISNLDTDGSILKADDRRRMFNLGNQLWHTDSSFKRTPAMFSMLHARSIPPAGGETEFADMHAAWDELPEATKALVEPLVCEHSLLYSRALLGFEDWTEEDRKAFAPVPQRLVRRHPGSGRKSLYLASHIGAIRGWPRPEALMLVRELMEHATQPRFVYRHKWRVNDLVIWDNRCTMHRGRPYDDKRYERDMRRATTEDVGPTLEQPA